MRFVKKIFGSFFRKDKNKIKADKQGGDLSPNGDLSQDLLPNDNLLSFLNEEQRIAAQSTEGYIRVIAGAGSGKTRALAYRFAYLVNVLGVSPSRILAVTFTNKAAGEMKKRIRNLIGDQDTSYINTFHGFCVRILREDIHKINYPKSFLILDEDDQKTILSGIYTDLGITIREITYKNALKSINDSKKHFDYVELVTNPDSDQLELTINKSNSASLELAIFTRYLLYQRKNFALDFNDLLMFVLFIFHSYEPILVKWQQRLEYIQVDEFQDVSDQQYEFVKILSLKHKNLFVVGDPDQTIYSWRGADVRLILDFDTKFDNVKTIFLNKNYRSSPEILEVSNSLIKKNKYRIDKSLIPVKSVNCKVHHYHAKNTVDEAKWIAEKILNLKAQGVKAADIAILYRAHYVSRPIEEALISQNIAYKVYSGISFYQRREIKDIISYLRLVAIGDDLSFERVINIPRRGIGKKRIDFLKEQSLLNKKTLYESLKDSLNNKLFANTGAGDFVSVIENARSSYHEQIATHSQGEKTTILNLLDQLLKKSGYEELLMIEGDQERLDNMEELKFSLLNYEQSAGELVDISEYLARVSLLSSTDNINDHKEFILLMTVHSAKGLEFPYVFVSGMNEGVFPSSRVKCLKDMEEERRLAYVAFTRAEVNLFLTESYGFTYDGASRYPSRFIFNVDQALLERSGELDEKLFQEATIAIDRSENAFERLDNQPEFQIDEVVFHPVFGQGVVVLIDEETEECFVKFEKLNSNRLIKREFLTKLPYK